ncbi:MAG TPA: hypothetical protein PK530_16790, partial [Anaerolineales bacterium]|nr:hypothetical protein [Anaerolineales bacterium]
GKKVGVYTGRVAVRASGSFNIQTKSGIIQSISYKYNKIIQRGDGYRYQQKAKLDVTGTPPQ